MAHELVVGLDSSAALPKWHLAVNLGRITACLKVRFAVRRAPGDAGQAIRKASRASEVRNFGQRRRLGSAGCDDLRARERDVRVSRSARLGVRMLLRVGLGKSKDSDQNKLWGGEAVRQSQIQDQPDAIVALGVVEVEVRGGVRPRR